MAVRTAVTASACWRGVQLGVQSPTHQWSSAGGVAGGVRVGGGGVRGAGGGAGHGGSGGGGDVRGGAADAVWVGGGGAGQVVGAEAVLGEVFLGEGGRVAAVAQVPLPAVTFGEVVAAAG